MFGIKKKKETDEFDFGKSSLHYRICEYYGPWTEPFKYYVIEELNIYKNGKQRWKAAGGAIETGGPWHKFKYNTLQEAKERLAIIKKYNAFKPKVIETLDCN